MATRNTGRVFGALAMLAVFLPLSTLAGCKLLNREKKQFGEDCTSDTDCDSVECATYGSICTKACTYDKECGAGYVCRARDGGKPGDACAKPTGNPVGGTCNNAAECQSGNCLKPVGQNDAVGFCSGHCETSDECPTGYKIRHSISDDQKNFCLPGDPAAAITNEPPKFVAPRPISTVRLPTTTTTTTTTTTQTQPTASPIISTSRPTATAAASGAPTVAATSTASAKPTTSTTAAPRPGIVLHPVAKPKK